MTTHALEAQKRTIRGRKVKNLRKSGFVPGTVYGKGVESLSVQVNRDTLLSLFKEVGETGLVELSVDKTEKRPVLISLIQTHPVTGDVLHVDFRQVNLKEKISAMVPVELVGESPAVKNGIGNLVQQIDEVEVEALPTELPDHFELSIDGLLEIDQALYVKDIVFDAKKIEMLTDTEMIIAKIEGQQAEEVVTPAAETETTETPATEAAPTAEAESEAKSE